MVAGKDLVLGERQQGLAAAFTGLNLELAACSGLDDEVLQQAVRGNASLQLGIGIGIAMAADIARGLHQLAQRDRLDHGTYS